MPSVININSVSPAFRDILLGLNLKPSISIVNNGATNYTPYLGGVGGSTAVGLPVALSYLLANNSNTTNIQNALFLSLTQNGTLWRPYNYTLNQYEGAAADYADAGGIIGPVPTLTPASSGTTPYSFAKAETVNGTVPNIYQPTTVPASSLPVNVKPFDFLIKNNNFNDLFYQYNLKNIIFSPVNVATLGDASIDGLVYGANLNLNLYKGNTNEIIYAPDTFVNTVGVTNQKNGYLDANGKLNVGGPSTEPLNTITSLLHGGVGFNKNGSTMSVVNNNDIRNTIVGRALSATGLINDTQLGLIGAERLAISLANNAAFKLQKETIGRVNLDIFSYIDGKKDDFIVPNYEITIPAGKFGKVLDFLGDLAGFTMPRSQMKTDFFSFDDTFKPTLIGNIARANGMLETTGKGQVISLFRNIQANLSNSNFIKQGYAPGFVSKRVDGEDGILHNVYAYGNADGEILENTDSKRADSAQYDNSHGSGNGNGRWSDTNGSGFDGDYFNFKVNGNGGNTGNDSTGTESDFIWADTTINVDKTGDGTSLIDIANEIFGPSPSDGETNSLNQPNRKSILYKTKELFKNGNMSTMVNAHVITTDKSQIQTAVLPNGMMSKGNAALTSVALEGNFGDKTNIYCRTWTPMDKYDQIADLVRHRKLDGDGGDYFRRSPLSEFSVLENTGFVKIARYVTDSGSVKRHMFSIENLAWMGKDGQPGGNPSLDLAPCEKGPFGGRIMWFPPYDIKFSESTSVNWDKHNFIGRGEPMYTYNNAERTGQLSFKIIIDHPNKLNVSGSNITKDDKDDNYYASFFAGCNPADILSETELAQVDKITNIPKQTKVDDVKAGIKPTGFSVFFPNDNSKYPTENPEYESGLATLVGADNIKEIVWTKADENQYLIPRNYNNDMGNPVNKVKTLGPISPIGLLPAQYDLAKIIYSVYTKGDYLGLGMTKNSVTTVSDSTKLYTDRFNYGLNANRYNKKNQLTIPGIGTWDGWLAGNDTTSSLNKSYLEALKEYIHHQNGTCKTCVIEITGYASVQGNVTNTTKKNKTLSNDRANNIKTYLIENLMPDDPNKETRITVTVGKGETTDIVENEATCIDNVSDQDSISCKLSRRTFVNFKVVPELAVKPTADEPIKTQETTPTTVTEIVAKKIKDFYTECDYFNKLSESDPFTYSKLTDKIKYFSPAFHSTTPEGFNARLTFLQQCTRQGPSLYTNSSKPDNLVFGRPPVCVLRIGDFYYTKIIIENISFDFEPLVWDLNPEGVGVQPMIANVSMNFAFIGGSSLDGPISKLQNALSSNYFANTGLFDTNADDNQPRNQSQAEINKIIADRDNNTSVYESPQIPELPETDKALTTQEQDKKILEEGILSLTYDDSGIFQGKVKGSFTVKSKLSKVYDVKLTTKVNSKNPDKNLGDEPIDTQKLKLNDLKIDLTSKNKTTNSLQKWDYYFTDTVKPINTSISIYDAAQNSLDNYVINNVPALTANGWEFNSKEAVGDYNYDFIIEVKELDYKKEYKARWSPIFKVDKIHNGIVVSYKAYLSGGKLAIINDKLESPDEVTKKLKETAKENKAKTKGLKKDDKAIDKSNKIAKKRNLDEQKALVINGGGSLTP
jgi:hypothetical protein